MARSRLLDGLFQGLRVGLTRFDVDAVPRQIDLQLAAGLRRSRLW